MVNITKRKTKVYKIDILLLELSIRFHNKYFKIIIKSLSRPRVPVDIDA